jgi:hypothetical protein
LEYPIVIVLRSEAECLYAFDEDLTTRRVWIVEELLQRLEGFDAWLTSLGLTPRPNDRIHEAFKILRKAEEPDSHYIFLVVRRAIDAWYG